jgi:acyl-coenzyme A thioesterase PaaI-like protein
MTVLDGLRARALEMPRSQAERLAWQDRFNLLPASAQFGFKVDLSDSHIVQVVLDELKPYHRGGLGTPAVNGAVISGMFDIGFGLAGTQQFPDRPTGTVDLSLKLMRPTLGPQVILYAWSTVRRTHVVYVEAQLHDSTSGLCALGSGIVAVSSTLQGNNSGS